MAFESAVVSGYPYDSNCLHTIRINSSTWDGKSPTIRIPITSDCGFSSSISYTSTYVHKLSIVLPPQLGNLANASVSGDITWSGGTYTPSTRTWTKYFTQDQPYDFPNIAAYVNNVEMGGSNNFMDNKATMFIGYSTTPSGTPEYDDFGLFRTGTSDLTLYPCVVAFGDSLTVTGLTSYDGPATASGDMFYSTITPMATVGTIANAAGNGIKIWSKHSDDGATLYPASANVVDNTNLVIASSVAGTKYNLKSGANARGSFLVSSVFAYPAVGGTIPAKYDDFAGKCYYKIGKSSVVITTILLPVPTPSVQLVYNGNNQTQSFADYDSEFMTVQYRENKDSGTYTAIFTLKDTVLTHWADDSIDQKLVT